MKAGMDTRKRYTVPTVTREGALPEITGCGECGGGSPPCGGFGEGGGFGGGDGGYGGGGYGGGGH
jgi:hypothetical protein